MKPDLQAAWFSPWTCRSALWAAAAFLIMSGLEFPFVFFFDTMLTDIGFTYVYFWALPQALVLYFISFKLRTRWTSTILVGLMGVIGAPVDYYFEWVAESNLLSPICAFLYIPLYLIAGLSADVSLTLLHPEKRPIRAAWISALVFTFTVIVTTVAATYLFYPSQGSIWAALPAHGVFLIPYALVTGMIGGYLGMCLARDAGASPGPPHGG
jgi:hypothetical protein